MNSQHFSRIEEIFQQVVNAAPDQQAAVLEDACGGDATLRRYVDRLLQHDATESAIVELAESSLNARMPRSSATDLEELIGTTIDRYRILEPIGEGGFGAVYLAEQLRPVTRRVALKIIKLGMDTKQVIGRFEAERQALAMMDHQNIARVLDAGATDSGRPFFVMEYVEGRPINHFCDEEQLTTQQRLDVFMDVCKAVQHAHQKGIIHRDIKPSNILVSSDNGKPVPKVIDFGIAKAITERLTERTVVTSERQLIGTPEYMSPEQADPSGVDVDTRSDIYSLGIILYELLTGTTPIESSRLRSVAMSEMQRLICDEIPERPSTRTQRAAKTSDDINDPSMHVDSASRAKQLKGDLDWIVMKALEKERDRRYATAAALAEDIERYLNDEPVEASPPSATYQLHKFVRRHKAVVASAGIIAAILVVAIFGLSYAFISVREERDQKETARQQSDAVTTFLSDMLSSVEPGDHGRDVTVREVLDEASKIIAGSFGDQPLIEAHLRHTIGDTYVSLGLYEDADLHITFAAETFRRELGPSDPTTLESLHSRAFLFLQQGRTSIAETLLDEVIERRVSVLGENHEDTLESQRELALIYTGTGRFDEAKSLFQHVLSLSKSELGDDHRGTLATMDDKAALHFAQGEYDEAEVLYTEALGLRERELGPAHPDTLASLNNLALLYQNQGRYAEAEATYGSTVSISRDILGPEHWQTLISMDNLAILYKAMGRYDEAEVLQIRIVDTARRVLGDEHPTTLNSRHLLASLYQAQGRFDDSGAMLLDVLEARKRVLGADHPSTLSSMHNLAVNYRATGEVDRSLPLLDELFQKRKAILGVDHPSTLATMHNLAVAYRQAGRLDDAEPMHLELFDLIRNKLGEEHPHTYSTMSSLAVLYHEQGRFDESESMQKTALEGRRKRLGESHPTTLSSRLELATLYLQRLPESDRDPHAAIAHALAAAEATNFERAAFVKTLADAYHLVGDTSAAIEALQTCLERLPSDSSNDRTELNQQLLRFDTPDGGNVPAP